VVSKFQHGTSLTYKKDYKKKEITVTPIMIFFAIFSNAFGIHAGGIEAGYALLADEELQAWYSCKSQHHMWTPWSIYVL